VYGRCGTSNRCRPADTYRGHAELERVGTLSTPGSPTVSAGVIGEDIDGNQHRVLHLALRQRGDYET
jgi:hypothetical protein